MRNGKVSIGADDSGRHVMQKTTRRSRMCGRTVVLAVMLLALVLPLVASADPVVLTFEPTAMLATSPPAADWPAALGWPPNGTTPSVNGLGATGYMMINQVNGQTNLQFFLRGARPNTLYTIWTVFKPLVWCTKNADLAVGCPDAFSSPAWSVKPGFGSFPSGPPYPQPFPGPFYPEAGVVAPTASMAKAFTNGMGPDPGATFYTNGNGDG